MPRSERPSLGELIPQHKEWWRENVLAGLRALSVREGALHPARMRREHPVLFLAAERFFGSFSRAIAELGIEVWTRESVLDELRRLSFTPIHHLDDQLAAVVMKMFGTIERAFEAAGVQVPHNMRGLAVTPSSPRATKPARCQQYQAGHCPAREPTFTCDACKKRVCTLHVHRRFGSRFQMCTTCFELERWAGRRIQAVSPELRSSFFDGDGRDLVEPAG